MITSQSSSIVLGLFFIQKTLTRKLMLFDNLILRLLRICIQYYSIGFDTSALFRTSIRLSQYALLSNCIALLISML